MHALVVPTAKPTRVEFVTDHPTPVPASGEVLIRVRLAGICATDLEIARGYMQFHGVLGHEFVGTVVAVGLGRRTVEDVARLLAARDRSRGVEVAPAHGLVLWSVSYERGLPF